MAHFESPCLDLCKLITQISPDQSPLPTASSRTKTMASADTSPLVYSNSGPSMVISCTVLAFISTILVALRFWARRLTRQNFGLDDWLCLGALLCHHVVLAAGWVQVYQGGLGRDIRITSTEDPRSVVILFQVLMLI